MFFENIRPSKELVIEWKTGVFEEHDLHMHDALEIHVLRENEARFATINKQYEGKPGDVFLFRPFEPHWNLVKDRANPIRWISILFFASIMRTVPEGSKLLYPFYAVLAVSPYIPAESTCAQAVQDLAYRAILEQEERRVGWEARQFALFIDILVHLLRHSFQQPLAVSAPEMDDGMFRAIEYMLKNFAEDLNMNDVISITGRQRTHFYIRFKAVTGVTPNQFIHRLRMQVAMYQLGNTNKSITEIAFDCGYQSIHYFIKHFNQYCDMTPREYRKIVKQKQL
ncbi:AraC family transcriptional regulator [Paenibacillus sp. NPDC056579]|uniref:helix-turn-helix transcriptional regulator n=1 Tax=Paenibacillus sp. NPDC056579 TaxID=3345871 RepID=UPI0036AF4E87